MGVVDDMVVHVAGMTYPWRENETGWWLDPEDELWRPLPPLAIGRSYTRGISSGDTFYVVGGRRGNFLSDVFSLTRVEKRWVWKSLPDMLYPRGVPSLAIAGSSLFVIGGGSWGRSAFIPDDVPGDEMLSLHRPDKGWTEIPKCPGRRRANACAAALGDCVYVFGGMYSWEEEGQQKVIRLRDAWRFNTETASWHDLPPLPCPGLSGAAAIPFMDRYIIILGGAIPSKKGGGDGMLTYRDDPKRGVRVGWYNEIVFVYDSEKNSYVQLHEKLPWGTHDIRASILDDTIFAIGGETVDASTSNTCSNVRVGKIEEVGP